MFWDVLSSFFTVAGKVAEATAAMKAASFNQNQAKYNANVTRQQGVIAEDQVRRDSRRKIGLIRANYGASGFEGGSFDDVLADSAYEAEMAALTTRYNYKSAATGYDMQAKMYGSAKKDAFASGFMNAGSVLLKQYNKNQTTGQDFELGGGSDSLGQPDTSIYDEYVD